MAVTTNRQPQSVELKFFDGSSMSYRFDPGQLTYESATGLVLAFTIEMADGSSEEVALCPRPSKLNADILLAEFLTPFGLSYSAGKLVARSAGGRNAFTTFAGYLLGTLTSPAILRYLDDLKKRNSSYYTMDDRHALRIREPIYIRS